MSNSRVGEQRFPYNNDDLGSDDSENSRNSESRSGSEASHSPSHSHSDSYSNCSNTNSLQNSEDEEDDETGDCSNTDFPQENHFETERSRRLRQRRSKEIDIPTPNTRIHLITERPLHRIQNRNGADNRPLMVRPGVIRRIDRIIYRMCVFVAKYHKELCIVFLLVASGLATLRSGPLKTRTVQTPQPFFTSEDVGKYLQDNYKGEYVDLVQKNIPFNPSFIFYYAPWDSESVAAKSVFLRVAQHFHSNLPGQVKFFAVNCWWPDGQCRQNYKNLSHYPIFVAHIGSNSGIIYSGPIRVELMIRFINSVLKPITRIDDEDELWRFRAQHDAIMLGYFNFSESDSAAAYETYLQMALRNFEADPFAQVGFGLFLRAELAEKFFLTSSNAISLVLFNEIHTAKWHGGYHAKGLKGPVGQVAEWIIERTKKTPITWAYRVRNGFANRPVALGPVDFAQELARGPVFLLITRRYYPSAYSPFYAQVKEVALDYFNCNNSGNVTKLRRTTHKINSELRALWKSISKICRMSKSTSSNCNLMESQLKHWEEKRYLFRNEALSHYENISASMNFTGFSCASERQFRFLTVDPVDVPHFINLGLSGLGYQDQSDPLAFIIDAENEVLIPVTTFNISDVATAIYNFTINMENGESQFFTSASQHWVERVNPKLKRSIASSNHASRQKHPKNYERNSIKKLTSEDVQKFLRKEHPFEESTPLLIMYTAKFCGFCSVALAHFIGLATFLSEYYYKSGVNVTLAKLDMFKNSLPVEFSPTEIPTIVFFPAENRSDSRVFPIGEEINAKTLLRFLLSELGAEARIRLSLESPACNNNQDCNSKLRKSTNSNSGREDSCQRYSSATNTSEKRDNCLHINKVLVNDQIHSILERLKTDLGLGAGRLSETVINNNPDSKGNIGVGGELQSESVNQWTNQLLEHLRSMRLTLDVSQ